MGSGKELIRSGHTGSGERAGTRTGLPRVPEGFPSVFVSVYICVSLGVARSGWLHKQALGVSHLGAALPAW